jgi:hypothetical protein
LPFARLVAANESPRLDNIPARREPDPRPNTNMTIIFSPHSEADRFIGNLPSISTFAAFHWPLQRENGHIEKRGQQQKPSQCSEGSEAVFNLKC